MQNVASSSNRSLLKEAFLFFDKDGNNSIDVIEFHDVIQALGLDISLNQTKRIICELKRIDYRSKDIDYTKIEVTIDDFLELISSRPCLSGIKDLREAFSVLDYDRSGVVDTADLRSLFTALQPEFPLQIIDEILEEIEKTATNQIDYDHFVNIIWQAPSNNM